MNINWWIRNIRPNYCISEFKCDLNSNILSSKTCNVFRVIIILYTIDLYVVLIPQHESKWNKIVSIQTMSNPKILCLPLIANTLRDLDMQFTWVVPSEIWIKGLNCGHKCSLKPLLTSRPTHWACADPGIFVRGGVQVSLTKKMLWQRFFFFFFFFFSPQRILQKSNGQWSISKTSIIFQGSRGGPTFSRGEVQLFPGGGGGGSNCLFPLETHITCPDPLSPLWIRTCWDNECGACETKIYANKFVKLLYWIVKYNSILAIETSFKLT